MSAPRPRRRRDRPQPPAAADDSWRASDPYHLLFERHPQPMWVWDLETFRFLAVNEAAVRHYGYSREDFLAMTIKDIRPADDVPRFLAYMKRRPSGPVAAGEWPHLKKDGSVILAQVRATDMTFGGRAARLVVVHDVTDAARVQREFHEIFEHASVGIFRSSRDGRILLANRAFARMLGYDSPAELRALELARDVYVRSDEREELIRKYEPQESGWALEIRWKKKDGTPIWVLLNAHAVRDQAGKTQYFEGFVQDITDRREAAQELVRSRKRLRALAARLEEVRERERQLLAREVHDELGQALTALRMDLAWLRDRLPAGPLVDRSDTMMGVADGLIARVRRIAADLRPAVLDDLGLAAALEWQTQDVAHRCGIRYALDLPADGIVLDDRRATALFRIAQEALTNVARHARATRVAVRLHRDNGDVVLVVEDDGCGIRDADLAGGHSLGLLGMRERAAELGGYVAIDGAPGRGTAVLVRMPIEPPPRRR